MISNCERCTKGARENQVAMCDIQDALVDAYNWCCGEVEWTEEWK